MNEFRVSIKSISEHPVAESRGDLSHTVTFLIESPGVALSTEWDGGTVRGEELQRCSHLQEKGSVTVAQPENWKGHRPDRWQEEIVNLALDHSMSESA